MLPGANNSRPRTPQAPSANPRIPPAPASITLSVSNCRMTRQRPAPMAARIASSLCRTAARASSRLATLAQAIKSTKATAPSNTSSAVRTEPVTMASAIGTTPTDSVLSIHVGLAARKRSPTTFISARACATVTPGFRRPATRR